jgi:hypothetical protein
MAQSIKQADEETEGEEDDPGLSMAEWLRWKGSRQGGRRERIGRVIYHIIPSWLEEC